jgi:hypothetical protein
MLYSTQGLIPYTSSSSDYYNITTAAQAASLSTTPNFTQEVPILLPQGIKSIFSQNAGSVVTLC